MNGFLARLAELNSFDRVGWIPLVAKVRFPKPWYREDEIERLSAVTGVCAEELKALSPSLPYPGTTRYVSRIFGHQVPAELFIRKDFRRVCPLCTAENAQHNQLWDLRFVRSCTRHGTPLLDQCLICRRRLGWRTRSLRQCHCGVTLDFILPPEVISYSEAHQAGSRFLQNILLGVEQAVPPLLRDLQFDEIFELLHQFARIRQKSPFKLDNSVDAAVEAALSRGLEVLSQSPADLAWELRARAKRWKNPNGNDVLRRLTEIHDWLGASNSAKGELAAIVRRVLEEPPEDPGPKPSLGACIR